MGRILIIEDDPLVARMYQKVLEFEGIEVHVASNGRDGVQKAFDLQPNLILCDVMMPKMNGLEVLDCLKAAPETNNIPIVMLTNLSGTQDANKALAKGALAYMVKSEYKPKDVAVKAKEMIDQLNTPVQKEAAPLSVQQSQSTTSVQPVEQAQTTTATPPAIPSPQQPPDNQG